MPSKPFRYTGSVPARGFRWLEARQADAGPDVKPQRFLVALSADEGEEDARSYDLEEVDEVLFRVFARTSPNPNGILDFANHYGRLGIGVPIRPGGQDAATLGPVPIGEPFKEWQRQV